MAALPYGTLERVDGGARLLFVRAFTHECERTWAAIAEADGMAHWFPARMEGERRPGAQLRFIFAEAPDHESRGEMLAYKPLSLMELRWQEDTIRAQLVQTPTGCELTFTARFDEVGKAARDAAGWHVCLDNLEAYLDGRRPHKVQDEAWKPLMTRYSQLFGPDASTIGPPDWYPEQQTH